MYASRQATLRLALASLVQNLALAQNATFGPSAFTAPGAFPTSVYGKYYNSPTATSAQVQPVITDPVLHKVYPSQLTSPNTIPTENHDPHPLPPKASESILLESAFQQIVSINTNPVFSNPCARCMATLEVAKFFTLASPNQFPDLAIRWCQRFKLAPNCTQMFSVNGFGSVLAQVMANTDAGGLDGQWFCHQFFGACPVPPTTPLNLTGWFAKPKPNPLPAPKKPSGKRLKVLHISDFHLDPRYATGSEANCSSGICCRSNNPNPSFPHSPSVPAPRFGHLLCDTPFSLGLAALEAIPILTGTNGTGFDFSIYTGDLVSHDTDNQLSRDYVMYTETVVFDLFRKFFGSGPVYATLGNHDSYNQAQDAPHSLGGQLAKQFSWNYDHLSELWQHEGWLPNAAVAQAKTHYAGYSVQRKDHLRVISLNTDMWYRPNLFNYINLTNSDNSGMLRFLTDELQAAEDAGDRAWIIGHVPSGWDGSNPLPEPTNLFYQIVDRFSPHVIAGIFFGHTHEDQLSIFYANNGTTMDASTAGAVSWLGPSIVPRTNLNSGFRMYEVDSQTFDVLDAYTWYSNVSSYGALDSQTQHGPTYSLEYSTRAAYGANIGWGASDPLNATWWHHVTEQMLANPSLMTTFTNFQGKQSVHTKPCNTDACVKAKVCYMRSGSASIAMQNCQPGFGSVQG